MHDLCTFAQLSWQHARPLYFCTVEFAVVQYPYTIAQLSLLFDIFVTFGLPYILCRILSEARVLWSPEGF